MQEHIVTFVEYAEVEGFWGSKRVCLPLKEDINFIIGANGSGKTTLINLLSAALRADIPTLYSIQFKKIHVRLKVKGANRKPVVEVVKEVDPDTSSFELRYTIKDRSSEKGTNYIVDGPFDERRYYDPRYASLRRLREEGARLGSILGDVVQVNWLSVHRSAHEFERRRYRDEDIEPSVRHLT